MRPDCLHTIFLNYILPCPSIIVDIIKRTFQKKCSLYIACNDRNAFFTSDTVRNYNLWSCQKVCEAVTFLLDNIYIRCGSKLYRQSTNCAPLVADLFFVLL